MEKYRVCKNKEQQNFLNNLKLLTKEEIIERLSMFYNQATIEASSNLNELEDKYMVNEFGAVKRTLLNRLKIILISNKVNYN